MKGRELQNDFKILFSSERGQNVLRALERFAPFSRGPVDLKHSVEPTVMAIHNGRADVVKYIYQMMKLNPMKDEQQFATIERKVNV